MKILMFIESLAAGGKERRLVELLKGLEKHDDVQCALVLMKKDIHYRKVLDLEIDIHYLIRAHRRDPKIFLTFFQLCKSWKPDIIHSWGPMSSIYALPTVFLLGIKFINAMITGAPASLKEFKSYNLYKFLTFPVSHKIVSNSRLVLEMFSPPDGKSTCIHNGFDFSRTANLSPKEHIKRKFGIETSKVVGMVASYQEHKDYDTFYQAAEEVLDRCPDVTFVSVGDGVNYKNIAQKVGSKLGRRVKFLGRQNDVESIINIFDVAVLSSLGEGLPNAVLEYMALAKPVVTTDVGGTSELVIHGETGYLVPPRDTQSLVDRIILLLQEPSLAEKLGVAGKERVLNHFNIEGMIDQNLDLYNSVVPVRKRVNSKIRETWETKVTISNC